MRRASPGRVLLLLLALLPAAGSAWGAEEAPRSNAISEIRILFLMPDDYDEEDERHWLLSDYGVARAVAKDLVEAQVKTLGYPCDATFEWIGEIPQLPQTFPVRVVRKGNATDNSCEVSMELELPDVKLSSFWVRLVAADDSRSVPVRFAECYRSKPPDHTVVICQKHMLKFR